MRENNIRILYINAMGPTENAPLGGIFVSHRIKALKELGVEIIPVSFGERYDLFAEIALKMRGVAALSPQISEQIGVCYSICTVRFNILDLILARVFGKHNGYRGYKSKIYKLLKKQCFEQPIDIIHLHWMWPAGLGVYQLWKEENIPYVITCHGSDVNFGLAAPGQGEAAIKILENAAAVEFVSKALFDKAVSRGYSGKNGVVISNGINTEIFYNRNERKSKKKVVAFVGNLIPVKGADRLPAIFRNIYESYEGIIEFCVIGSGSLEQNLKKEMEGLPVIFTGRLTPQKVADEYAKMDVLVVPSRSEGYPCAIKEAQACGVIPVGNDVGGICEAIGEDGIVVSEEDEQRLIFSLSQMVLKCLRGDIKFDMAGISRHAAECSWLNRQKMSLDVYNRILEEQVDE